MSNEIFLSYRRSDGDMVARAIEEALVYRFGPGCVFLDRDSIQGGQRWREIINKAIAEASVALVLIGPRWLSAMDENHRRRIDSKKDVVRHEIREALRQCDTVVPIYSYTKPLKKKALPKDLQDLAELDAESISSENWKSEIENLCDLISTESGLARSNPNSQPDIPPPDGPKAEEPTLTDAEIKSALAGLRGWKPTRSPIPGSRPQSSRDEICKTFKFGDFDKAWYFMEQVAHEARMMSHHPRWENQYGGVTIWLSTWAADSRITKWDVKLATRIDDIYREQTSSER